MEIRHARWLGPGAGAVRHDLYLCRSHWKNRRPNAAKLQLVASAGDSAATRPPPYDPGVYFRAGWLWHQGRPGPDAHLAARRPQRSALAHQRDALRRVTENRPLCAAALSHSGLSLPRHRFQPQPTAGLRLVLDVAGRAVHSGAEKPQTAAGLLQPGARWIYLRGRGHERAADDLRRAVAYGLSRPDQTGAVLCGGQHSATLY